MGVKYSLSLKDAKETAKPFEAHAAQVRYIRLDGVAVLMGDRIVNSR